MASLPKNPSAILTNPTSTSKAFRSSVPQIKPTISSEFKFSEPIVESSKWLLVNSVKVQFRFSEAIDGKKQQIKSDLFKWDTTNLDKKIWSSENGNWVCDTCLVNNNSDRVKCAACETPKPNKDAKEMTSIKLSSNDDKKWGCKSCKLANSETDVNCKCCGADKSGNIATNTPLAKGFQDYIKLRADTWECRECFVRNKSNDSVCAACSSPKSGGKSKHQNTTAETKHPATNAPSLKSMFTKTTWECDTCFVNNKNDAEACIACTTPRPGSTVKPGVSKQTLQFGFAAASSATSGTLSTSGFSFGISTDDKKYENAQTSCKPGGFTFGIPPSELKTETKENNSKYGFSSPGNKSSSNDGKKWDCKSCKLANSETYVKCKCCGADKSGNIAKNTPLAKGFQDYIQLTADTWECKECFVRTNSNDYVCVACSNPKPGGKSKPLNTTSETKAPITTTAPYLNSIFTKNSWKCDTCLVNNKNDADACIACTTPRPGSTVKLGVSKPTFQFGFAAASSATSGTLSTSGFSFGISTDDKKDANAQTSSKPGGFTFGIPPSELKTETKENNFKFGISSSPGNKSSPNDDKKWDCKSCKLANSETYVKCKCCGADKSGNIATNTPLAKGLHDYIQLTADTWECKECFVKNKSNYYVCVACSNPKLGGKSKPPNTTAETKPAATTAPSLNSMFTKNSWECDTCLVNNKNDADSCIACTTPRPGSKAKPAALSVTSETPSTDGFSFGIPTDDK